MGYVFLCGEDKRFIECKKILKKEKINCKIINNVNDLIETNEHTIIVLPFQGIEKINGLYDYLFSNYHDSLYICYNVTKEMDKYFTKNNLNILNLNQLNKYSLINNVATAEATLKYIIDYVPKGFNELNIAILGYGKCGKELYDLYKKLDINCNVFVRREEVKKSLGTDGYLLNELNSRINTYDLIINTIPSNVIDENLLHKISLNTVILELASAPYGLNQDIANGLGLKYYILKGLPGVHRHITLGKELAKIIKECL